MITAIILAAGRSSRMKTPKLLLDYRGRPILRHVVETVLHSCVGRVIVVLGHEAAEIEKTLQGLPLSIVVNQNYSEGMSSSLQAGLVALEGDEQEEPEGILFVLGDQPTVKPTTIDDLIYCFTRVGGIIAPTYKGIRGNPVLFSNEYLAELRSLSGDTGARQVIAAHPEVLTCLEVGDRGVILDVDTWTDYCELT